MKQTSVGTPFFQLLLTDFFVFKQAIVGKIINVVIWIATTVTIATYIMPSFGLSKSYGPFLLAGSCASAGLFELFPSVVALVNDLNGDQTFFYHLTLPLPSWLLIVRHMLFNAFNAFFLTIIVLPMGKLLLWDKLVLSNIAWGKLLLIFVLQSLFYGAISIFIASFVPSMNHVRNIWARFIFPFWMLGGYQYSWTTMKSIAPQIATLSLLNPIIYIMEGTRAALLGQEGFLNFWLCAGVLATFTVLAGCASIMRLRRSLDIL